MTKFIVLRFYAGKQNFPHHHFSINIELWVGHEREKRNNPSDKGTLKKEDSAIIIWYGIIFNLLSCIFMINYLL